MIILPRLYKSKIDLIEKYFSLKKYKQASFECLLDVNS